MNTSIKAWAFVLLTILVLGRSNPVMAQTHLEPEPGLLSDADYNVVYLNDVRQILRTNLADPVANVVVLPSFQPEWMVSVETSETGGYVVNFAEADQKIWMSKAPDQITVTRTAAPLDAKTAELIHEVWFQALLGVRAPQTPRLLLDGTDYHFSCYKRMYGTLSGRTHSPENGTIPRGIVSLGDLLKGYAQATPSERPSIKAKIQNAASSILGKLSYETSLPTSP